MELLNDVNGEIDVDVNDLLMDIDHIFHRRITDECGITVSHRDIQKFIFDIINKSNKKQLELRRRDKELKNDIKRFDKMYKEKIKDGKVVKDLKGIKNRIKFHILNYVLVHPIGCGTPTQTTRCDECCYEYGGERCKYIRKDNEYPLLYDYKRFICDDH
jgi:hypothetical protein